MKHAQDALRQTYVFLPSPRWPGKSLESLLSARSWHTTLKDSGAETTASHGLSPDAEGRRMQMQGLPRWESAHKEVILALPYTRGRLLPQPRWPPSEKWVGLALLLASLMGLYFRAGIYRAIVGNVR